MTYATDPRIDAYIDALPDWQQAICREVRDLVHGADPEVVETIKRTRLAWQRTAIGFGAVGLVMLREEPAAARWCS